MIQVFLSKVIGKTLYPFVRTTDLFRLSATSMELRRRWFLRDESDWITLLQMHKRMEDLFKWKNVTFKSFVRDLLPHSKASFVGIRPCFGGCGRTNVPRAERTSPRYTRLNMCKHCYAFVIIHRCMKDVDAKRPRIRK